MEHTFICTEKDLRIELHSRLRMRLDGLTQL